jgi:hypothetical protein
MIRMEMNDPCFKISIWPSRHVFIRSNKNEINYNHIDKAFSYTSYGTISTTKLMFNMNVVIT